MSTSESRSAVVLELAEEFLERYRKGERPAIKDYTDRNPELAGEIREVFPAMAMMEKIAIRDDSLDGEATDATCGVEATAGLLLEQLGDYRIIREIGHGGMGVVYEAEQVSLGRHVALKVLPPQMVRDRKQQQRFEREARAAAKLHHTNIVPVFGVGEHKGNAYYVMQYIQGQSLDAVIEELERMRSGGLENQVAGVAVPGDTQPHDATAAEVARSLLTGRFEAATANGSTQNLGLASPGDLRLSPGSAGSPPGESIAATVADVATTAESSPQVIARAAIPRTAPGDSSAHALSSLSLPGASRDSRSKRSRSATYWQSVAQIGFQVADALDYAHKQGILHRDIKPSNLLLDSHGTVWVTDFGLAKADDQQNLTHTGDILGTIRYMPPEAFEGKYDARGDVYSLGLTLYELLALRPAFDQKDRGTLIRQVTHEDPPRLSKVRIDIPRDLETIVHKAIDRDPSHRYATADLLAADFQRFLEDEPILARRLSTMERLGRWRRRNSRIAAALALAAATLVIGSVVSTGFAIHAVRSARTARAESARQAAARGLGLIAQQDAGRGMLWLARAMDLDPEDASGVHRAVRINLSRAAREQIPTHRLTLIPEGANAGVAGVESAEGVRKVAFSPDGRVIATAHQSKLVRLWDASDGHLLCPPIKHEDWITAISFSPDSGTLWTASASGLLEGPDGFVAPGRLRKNVPISPDPSSQPPRSRFWTWDPANGGPKGSVQTVPGWVAAIQADGKSAAVALSANTFQIVDLSTGSPLGAPMVDDGYLSGFSPTVAFSPDGRRFAAGESNDWAAESSRAALIWDVPTGRLHCQTGTHEGYHIYAVAWSPDGKSVATGGHDCTLRVWDATTGVLRGLPRVMPKPIARLAYSPDGRTLAAALTGQIGDRKYSRSSVRLLDGTTGLSLGPDWRFDVGVSDVAFDPEGRALVVGLSDGTSQVWALADPMPALKPITPGGYVSRFAIGPDGTIAVGTDSGDVYLRDPRTGGMEKVFRFFLSIWDLAFSADGRTLAIGLGYNMATFSTEPVGRVAIVDVVGRKLVCPVFLVGEPSAHPYRFSRDGSILYTKTNDRRTLRRWDAKTGKSLGGDLTGPEGTTDVALSGDERFFLLSDREGHVRRRELATGFDASVWTLQKQGIERIVTGNDSEKFLTIGSDWSVRLWDMKTGSPLGPPIEHDVQVTRVALASDGRTLAAGTISGETELWDAPTGMPLGKPITLGGQGNIGDLGFLPGGSMVAFVNEDEMYLYAMPSGAAGRPDEIRRWAEVRTGWTTDASGIVAQLGPAEWERLRQNASAESAGGDDRAYDNLADRHLSQALVSSRNGESHAALWNFNRVLTPGTTDPTLLLGRAGANARLGRAEAAEADLKRVLELKPKAVHDWNSFCDVLGRLGAPDRRLALLEQAIEQTQGNVPVHVLEPVSPEFLPRLRHVQGIAGALARTHFLNQTKRRIRIHRPKTSVLAESHLDLAPESAAASELWLEAGVPVLAADGTTGAAQQIWLPELGDCVAVILEQTLKTPPPGDPRLRRSAWIRVKVLTGDLEEAGRIAEKCDNASLLFLLTAQVAANRDWPRSTVLLRRALAVSQDIEQSRRAQYCLALTLLAEGDLAGYEAVCRMSLAAVAPNDGPASMNLAAWICVLGTRGAADPGIPVKLAESAVAAASGNQERRNWLNTLGGALHRAGRFDEAIDRLQQAIQISRGMSIPQDWAFLAMAHFRKGQTVEAMQWLERFRAHNSTAPTGSVDPFLDLEVRLLRAEAEAVVRYDPIFPRDPFVH